MLPFALQAQPTLETFGKNRIQYKNFEWKVIASPNFEIYYYQGGNELAYFAARYVESDFDRLADLLGYSPYAKIKLFIYNSITDLQQSNVGLNNDNNVVVGGQTNFIKSRVEIPYTGSATDFKRELTLGIARTLIVEMMFGGSLKDMVQSSYLLTLPDWFISGAAAYMADGWSLRMDNYVRDAVVHKNLRKPAVLSGEDAVLVGQSIWNFIAERYGKSNISNILNLTRIIRNEENSIASTLGITYPRFLAEWRNYYTNLNGSVISTYTMPKEDLRVRKNNRNRFGYHQMRISPDGRKLAYSENLGGRYNLIVRSTGRKREQVVMSGGYKTINQRFDSEVPLINWRGNNQLAVVHVTRGEYMLSVYDLNKRFNRRIVHKSLASFGQVKNFDLSDDGRTIVLSGERNGKNDLFLYEISRGAVTQLTNDLYDDLDPQFMAGSNNAVVFTSNRRSDSLNADKGSLNTLSNQFDLYLLDPAQSTTVLKRLTTGGGNKMQPLATEGTVFFLDNATGIQQIYRLQLGSGEIRPVTGFRQNVEAYHINPADSSLAFLMLKDRREFIGYDRKFDFASAKPVLPTRRSQLLGEATDFSNTTATQPNPNGQSARPDSTRPAPAAQLVLREGEVDTDNYQFDNDNRRQREETTAQTKETPRNTMAENAQKQNVTIQGPSSYQNRFTTDNIVSSVLIDPLRGLGVLFNLSMSDVLENHRINGGLLGITDLQSSNFFGEYQYLKHRVDAGVRFDKKTYYFNRLSETFIQKYNLYKFQVYASYPLSVSSRFTFAPVFMNTRFAETGFNSGLIAAPVRSTSYVGLRGEFVFDNTLINGLNMIEGTRIKIRYENFVGIRNAGQNFDNLSIDIRNYKKIHRDIIFATRLAFGNFGGRDRKSYLLGGMDNWIFNSKEERQGSPRDVRIGLDNRDLLFNEFVTNLRGFRYDKVSGSTYILFNGELRLPIVKYFYRGPITSNFFKNLQLVGFADVGTAWTGKGPFSRQNSLNTEIVGGQGSPFRASVTNFKNPFLSGYGAGVRTLLLGYYVKFDAAWGVEDYVVGKARYYLTLGYDF